MAVQAALPAPKIYAPVGVDVLKAHSTAQFTLGTKARGADGQVFMYVQSSGAHALGACVAIDEDNISRGATTSNATGANCPGWPQIAITDGQYYWAAIAGKQLYGKQKDGVAANAQLYTSTSVGIMSSEGSAGNPLTILGAKNVGTTSGAGAAYEIMVLDGAKFVEKGIKITA